MEYTPVLFKNLPFGSLSKSDCSPLVTHEDSKAFLIRTPEQINLSGNEKLILPICGYYNLDTVSVLEQKTFIHFRKTQVKEAFQTLEVVPEREHEIEAPSRNKPVDLTLYKGQMSTLYFYFDLQNYLPNDLLDGEYEVYVTCGENVSNTSVVQVIRTN
ncbi:hypothetical protein [Pseudobdellovibrio exovorus]|uniref:Uncharacterized protein n=1 Tax=Pseudobdellovibrio exovorus JSS TaxID=1184267 RepID=M4V9B2_9BACT|nr:hypothetical protein [Pseudobdellovibrio exovorus]AGH95818.1 hypothetical protein A11Q_1602 [Pseudobdellovibrio exovorus JSS]